MKLKLTILFAVLALPLFGQTVFFVTDTESNNFVAATHAAIQPTDDEYSAQGDFFAAGLALGFAFGGTAFTFRLVRQTAKQNPEI